MIRTLSVSRCGLATAAVIAVVAAVPEPAPGASGATTLALNGAAAKSLRAGGVRIAALKPARIRGRQVQLPVRSGLAGSSTTLIVHRGGISMQARGESLRLTRLRLLLGKRARVTASLAGAGIDLFRINRGGKRDVDAGAGTVDLRGLRLKLTAGAARAIAKRLDVQLGKARAFGTLSSRVTGLLAAGDKAKPKGKGAAEETAASGCPAPGAAGPTPEDPLPVATRPAGALDVLGAAIDWHVRESFIRYIASGEGTSVSDGAAADPPVLLPGSSTPLTYDFHFPFSSGWHDGGTDPAPADDRAAIYFGGTVRFLYSGHEIDLATSSPEIEIAGSSSRAIFVVAEDGGAGARQVLVNLDLARAAAIESNGNTHTYRGVPGAIPSGTAGSVFAGFYAPGTEFGCFTVSYTTA